MIKTVLSGLMLAAVAVASTPTIPVVSGAKPLTTEEKAGVAGKGADWKLPVGNPQPPGRFPSGNPQLKPSK